MAKKRSLPAQGSTLLDFFHKSASSSKPSPTKASPSKKVKLDPEDGTSAAHPVCLLDSDDDEPVLAIEKPSPISKGKGKQKEQIVIDLPDSSPQQSPGPGEPAATRTKVEDEPDVDLKLKADPEEDKLWADENGIVGVDEFDELMAAVGDEVDASRTTCQKWEDDHPPDDRAHHTGPSPPKPVLPTRRSTGSTSIAQSHAGPSRARSTSTIKSADPVQIIDLDLDDDDDQRAPDFGDDDGRWNAEDDEQAEQDDPGEDDYENGLGDDDEFEGAMPGDGYDDGVVILDGDEDESVGTSSKSSFRPINSFQHVLDNPPSPPPPQKRDAFAMLMSKNKAVDEWKSADQEGEKQTKYGERRKAPFFKVLTGMPIAVDAFRYGKVPNVTTYLLSHAHSDHYTNLSKAWKHGPIYCSQTTGNLIMRNLKVDPQWVKILPYDTPVVLPDTGGVVCTMISANHCPGSSIFLFEGKRTIHAGDSPYPPKVFGSKRVFRYLHCGDFRASPKHILHPAIKKAALDEVYLDTTYLSPSYCFPPQPVVIASVAELTHSILTEGHQPGQDVVGSSGGGGVTSWLRKGEGEKEKESREQKWKEKGEKTLVVVGTYSIGKERLAKGIAQRLGTMIYAEPRKRAYIDEQTDDPGLTALMTLNHVESQVHLVPLRDISLEGLTQYLMRFEHKYDRILGYRPTGWTFAAKGGTNINPEVKALLARDFAATFDAHNLRPSRGSNDKVMMYGVPYSEHSSFFELTCFALSVPGEPRMIPTVNIATKKSRDKMEVWIKKWASEKKKREAAGMGGLVEPRGDNYW